MARSPAWNGYRTFVVTRKTLESDVITSFYLAPVDGEELPPFQPGQFVGVKLDVPGEPLPVTRSYTLSSSPAHIENYRLSIKRELSPPDAPDAPPGLSSNFMHDHVHEGSELQLRAPTGEFVLRPKGKGPVVMLSGGVGCTPMVSMLTSIADIGSKRDVWFIHGARNGAEHAFGPDIRGIAESHTNVHVHICYSKPGSKDLVGRDFDSQGHVDINLLRSLLPGPTPQFYLCGGTPFMSSLFQGLIAWGVDPFQINYEFFGPASDLRGNDLTHQHKEALGSKSNANYTVTFQKANLRAAWTSSHGSLLDLAEASGVNVDFICRSGMCQTCLAKVVDGTFEYEHPDVIQPRNGEILLCSARPTSDLILDV
ncbi:MAG: hypothetical protein CBB68_15045 [Rhodospirillaceae bacterium TMED8]|nr:oxidoreductase [Magnetovibrio sp.]OUT47745.1 MAG: hypothetical protein CBB68_15045 [Rhodospirillaceae bacterium TMED8]